MTKFKPGYKAVALKDYMNQFTKGKAYTVAKVANDPAWTNHYMVYVEEDDRGEKNGWGLQNFEPAYITKFNNVLEELIK